MLLCGIGIVVTISKSEIKIPDNTIKLTEEEMKARPVASIHIKEDPLEVNDLIVEAAELEEDSKKVYDFIPLEDDMQILCQELCEQYNVGFAFFLAMAESESAFLIDARGDIDPDGNARSLGLMQINKPNWYRYNLNANVPKDNVEIGIRMLSELIVKYQDLDKVIMGYKGGEGAMLSWVENGVRLKACDDIIAATVWWQDMLDSDGVTDNE